MMTRYAAFLRGINVGGNKSIKMADLVKTFNSLGLKNSKTLLASGNITFETQEADTNVLKRKIEDKLKKTFKHEISVLLRSMDEIQSMVKLNPYKAIKVDADTLFYVTLVNESSSSKSRLKIPFKSPKKDFTILKIFKNAIFWVRWPKNETTKVMSFLEKEFGKEITTRNWNTIQKLANG
jgi:uncharacterized protein (DUF1697 family)